MTRAPLAPQDELKKRIEDAIHDAEEVCATDDKKSCASAWDVVEELSAEKVGPRRGCAQPISARAVAVAVAALRFACVRLVLRQARRASLSLLPIRAHRGMRR